MGISPFELDEALANCIARKVPILITKKNDKDWQVYRTILTSSSLRNNITTGEQSLTHGKDGHSSGEVGVSFRRRHHKLLFCSTLQGNTLTWPTEVMKIPRRAYDRRCPKGIITVRFWAGGSERVYSQLEDISTGGMQVSAKAGEYETGSYLCSIDLDKPITVDAILRKSELQNNGRNTLSFQFVGLEFNQPTASRLMKLTREITLQMHQSARKAERMGPWH